MNFNKQDNFYIIKISRGEEVNQAIEEFCKEKAQKGGFFSGIGAVDMASLAHYSVADKKYNKKEFNEPLELTSLIGNVCFDEDEMIVHSHATLSSPSMEAIAGHLVKARVSGACEILFYPFSERIGKDMDEETGLKLMDF